MNMREQIQPSKYSRKTPSNPSLPILSDGVLCVEQSRRGKVVLSDHLHSRSSCGVYWFLICPAGKHMIYIYERGPRQEPLESSPELLRKERLNTSRYGALNIVPRDVACTAWNAVCRKAAGTEKKGGTKRTPIEPKILRCVLDPDLPPQRRT